MSQISYFNFEYAGQRKQTRHNSSFVKTGQHWLFWIDLLKRINPLCLWQTVSLPGTDSVSSKRRLLKRRYPSWRAHPYRPCGTLKNNE